MDNLSRREFLDEKGSKLVSRMLENLKQVFFKPLTEEQQKKKDAAFGDTIMTYLEKYPHLHGSLKDLR